MKVCYTAHASNLTGASRSLVDMVTAVKNFGVEPFVLLPSRGPLERVLADCEVDFAIARYHNSMQHNRAWKTAAKRVLETSEFKRVQRMVRALKPDLVHSNSLLSDVGMHAAYSLGIPYVCHLRDLVKEDHGMEYLHEDRTRLLAAGCSAAIAISDYVARYFASWFEDGQICVLRDGLDTNQYRINHAPILERETCHILLAGRFAEKKGQIDAIKAVEVALKQGLPVELILVGGPGNPEGYREDCIRYVCEHGLGGKVRILDFQDDISSLKEWADLSLTCSYNEALGRVTVEGMLAGCLVIGADAGATPEIINDGVSGLLYQAGSPEDLAGKIGWAMKHRDRCKMMAIAGQAKASEEYDAYRYAEGLVKVYEEVLRRCASAHH